VEGHKGRRRENEMTMHGAPWGRKEPRDAIYSTRSFLPTKR